MELISSSNMTIAYGSDEDTPPFPIDATIIEEDTWQVLAAKNIARESEEHPIRLMTSLIDQQPVPLGEVIIHGQEWRIVVIDLDKEQVCTPASITLALQKLALQIGKHKVSSISIPVLGMAYGGIDIKEFITLLKTHVLENSSLGRLKHIWLRVPRDYLEPDNGPLSRLRIT